MNVMQLSEAELMQAALVGSMRRVESVLSGRNKNLHAEKSDWATDIDGAAAEMVFAKWREVYWSAGVNTFKEPDVGTTQVRSTPYKDGHLIIRPNDKVDIETYVLVISDPPRYSIIGHIACGDAKKDKYWRKDSWWVPQKDLVLFEGVTLNATEEDDMSKYPDSGSMSRNKRREKDTHPEFTGSGEFEGREFWINAWVKEGKDGKFFSFSFKAKQPRQSDPVERVREGVREHFGRSNSPIDDGEIPFAPEWR